MKICIIDDDKEYSESLTKKILSFFQTKQIQCNIDQYSFLQEYKEYDFYFLDIVLKDENNDKSGFSIAQTILKNNPYAYIVFMSTEEQFVFDVFHLKAYYFMRKNNLENDLQYALNKVYDYYSLVNDRIEIVSQREKVNIKKEDIVFIEVLGRTSTIHTYNMTYKTNISLTKLQNQLDNVKFYKLNSYTLIHFKYIEDIKEKSLTLNKITLPLNKQYKDLMQKYMIYRRSIL